MTSDELKLCQESWRKEFGFFPSDEVLSRYGKEQWKAYQSAWAAKPQQTVGYSRKQMIDAIVNNIHPAVSEELRLELAEEYVNSFPAPQPVSTGVHCGCCGKWVPDQSDDSGWGLCESCSRPPVQSVPGISELWEIWNKKVYEPLSEVGMERLHKALLSPQPRTEEVREALKHIKAARAKDWQRFYGVDPDEPLVMRSEVFAALDELDKGGE